MNEDLGSQLSGAVIGAAIAVHRILGPGLDEMDYENALSMELDARKILHQCQQPLPLVYKNVRLDSGYRTDIILPGRLLIELKAVEKIHPLHQAQVITYLRLSRISLGLLVNFNVVLLKDGLTRFANTNQLGSVPELDIAVPEPDTIFDEITKQVLSAAIEVHRHLGPGLLRSVYEECVCYELDQRGFSCRRQITASPRYRDVAISTNAIIRLIVNDTTMVVCLCVNELTSLHLARARSLLNASTASSALVINFHGKSVKGNVRRLIRHVD